MNDNKKKIAIIGTQGVPNKYGGFETLVDYLAEFLSDQFDITIYCSSKVYNKKLSSYKGCSLKYVNFHANGIQSIPYDMISLIHSVKKNDKILVLGASGGLVFPFYLSYRDKFILNFGGLDWQRSKWNFFAKKILKISEKLAVLYSGHLISDNEGIKKYIRAKYNRDSELIAYGGDHALAIVPTQKDIEKYPFLNSSYCFSLARIQKDNNIELILEAFKERSKMPIVFIGNWLNSAYGLEIKKRYMGHPNILLLDAIYDQRELGLIRSNAEIYIHGHSAGGTNPSLVEAMNLGLPVIAYSSGFNEYTTMNKALYFKTPDELRRSFQTLDKEKLEIIGKEMKTIAEENYLWRLITTKYSEIFNK